MMRYFLFLLPFCTVQATYEAHHAEGWHWYENVQRKGKNKQKADQYADPVSQLRAFQKKVDTLKATAVMAPTFKNVSAYMVIQKALLERSSRFAERWLEVLYLRPELDYTRTHPTSQIGRHIHADVQRKEIEERIRALAKTHGLFFFFSGTCAYCETFAPIVKGFAQKYNWKVLAISVDGSTLKAFPHARRDQGVAEKLGIQALPALIAVHPQSGQMIPLSYGLSTHDQIEDRVRVLVLRRMP